jgi:hypothetical protein
MWTGHGQAGLNECYIGEWKWGKPNGYGVFKWMNGDEYSG